MTASEKKTAQLGNFRGDFDALATVMQQSWSQNHEQPLLYTAEYLRSAFEHPDASLALAPAIYTDTAIAAFGAALPRRMRFDGRDLRVSIACFLTVAAGNKGSGYGAVVWRELARRSKAAGIDGAISLCVEGDEMNRMIVGLARAVKIPLKHIFSVSYMARPLRRTSDVDPSAADGAVDIIMEASRSIPERTPLARVWSEDEATWQCRRDRAVVATHTVGDRRGVLTGYIMDASDDDPVPCLLIDDLLWGTLAPDERRPLLEKFLAQAAAHGAELAVTPVLGYADMEPLVAMRFRKTRRVLNVYLSLWNGTAPTQQLDSVYFDVF